jgi:hypothetical protein
MADTKASQLEELAYTALVADDDFIVVDASDTSMAASGTTKRTSLVDVGSWTPTGIGVSFAAAVGTYTRIGRFVMASFKITWPTTADMNPAHIKSLPAIPLNLDGSGAHHGGMILYESGGAPARNVAVTAAGIATLQDANLVALTNADMSGKSVRGYVLYHSA